MKKTIFYLFLYSLCFSYDYPLTMNKIISVMETFIEKSIFKEILKAGYVRKWEETIKSHVQIIK